MKEFFGQLYIKRILKYVLFLYLSLVVQNMLFTRIRPMGVSPFVLPAVCVAAGMFEGATWGSVFSLVLGIFADMAFVETKILFTLLFPVIAFFSGFVSQFFINRRFFAFMGITLVALFLTAVVQATAVTARDAFSFSMLPTIALQTIWSLPPAALAYFPPARWIE